MIVHCPRCRTRYRLPARGRGGEATYRCARCRHVFSAVPEEPRHAEPPPEPEPEELEDEEDRFRMGDDDEEQAPEPPPTPEPRTPALPAGDRPPARFALRALLGVSLGYALLSVYLYTHPDSVGTLLGTVPLVGDRLAETRMEPASIQLADVRGTYERVQDDQLVFVIAGTAINNAPVAARAIQIQGRIMGAEEQRQVVFCGAAPRDVHELSTREIGLLQALEPPKEWALGPGEQSPFSIVFVGPPKDLRQFAAEVVAVRVPSRGGVASNRDRAAGGA